MPTFQITAPDGRKFKVTGPNKEGALAALKAQLAKEQPQQAQTEAPDTSIMGALNYGTQNAQSLYGKGIQSFGELLPDSAMSDKIEAYGQSVDKKNQAEAEALNYQRPENADGIIKNIRAGDIGGTAKSLAYSTAEAAPQVAVGAGTSLAAGAAMTGAPVIGTGLAIGGTALGINQAMGANRAEKEEKGLDPTATITDLSTAIASGLIELTPLKGGGATLKVLREGVQEMGQEGLIIGGTAIQGGEYVPEEIATRVAEAGIVGATLAKGINTTITSVNKAGNTVFRSKDDLDAETGKAAGDVARMMDEIAKSEGYNRKNVDPSSQQGANAILDEARKQVRAEIGSAMDALNPEILKYADKATQNRFKEILRAARNKVSGQVTKKDLEFVKQKVGNTFEGRSLLNALRKANVVTEVYSAGLKGGVSQFTDNFNPLPRFGRSYTPAGLLTGNINMGAAAATGGQTLAIQIPAVLGGRAIDAVTGRRSKVNTFIRKNRKKAGLDDPTGPKVEGRTAALRAAAQQQAAAKKQADDDANAASYVASYNEGQRPNSGSPRGTVFTAIDEVNPTITKSMSPREVDQMISEILDRRELQYSQRDDKDAQIMLRAIEAYRGMLKTGKMTKREKPLSSVVAMVTTDIQRQTPPPPPQGGSPLPTGQTTPVSPRSARVQSGIDGNNAFLDNLATRIDEAPASIADKVILKQAIGDMRLNLGSDAVKKVKSIISEAKGNLSDKNLAEQFLKPYLDRVEMQQAARKAKANRKKPKSDPTPTTDPQGGGGPSVGTGGTTPPTSPTTTPQTPPEPKANPKPKKATEPQVKKDLPEAKATDEIGKVGSKYENGIQDVDTALEVAKLLGITVELVNSGHALKKRTDRDKAYGVFRPDPSGKGFAGTAFAIKAGGTYKGEKRTTLGALRTLLHEMAHGLTLGNMDGVSQRGAPQYFQNPMSNEYESGGSNNSYINSALRPIIEAKGKDPYDNPLIQEIIAVQETADAYVQSNPDIKTKVRPYHTYINHLNELKQSRESADSDAMYEAYTKAIRQAARDERKFKNYMESGTELAVDPMWVYLMNPKLAKDLMPLNTKMIREEFKKANSTIQFYSHPLATILAVTMGMGLLAALGLEEPDEEVMPDGILTA